MPSRKSTSSRLLVALLAAAWAAAAVPACDSTWHARERETIRAALERMQAAATEEPTSVPQEAAPKAAPEPAQGEVRLGLVEAIRLALVNNQDVQIVGYEPLRAEADLVEARSVYDPAVVASNTFGRSKRPIASTLDTGTLVDESLTEDTWNFSGGLQQRVPTGGTFSLTQQMDYLDTNSRLTVPNPQYTSGLTFELSQPLLKNLGDPEARAAIRVATLATGVSLQEFRRQVLETVSEVTAAYWQLAFNRRVAEAYRENLDLAREVLRREKVRAERGVSNELNIARATSAVASREARLVRAENRVGDAADKLKRLLAAPHLPLQGRAEVIPADAPRFFVVDVDRTGALARALARRPELIQARHRIQMQRIRVHAADRQRLPRLDALLRYTLNGLGQDLGGAMDMQHVRDPVTWVAGLELEWPLGNRAARAEYRRRRVQYEQTLLEADRLTGEVMEEVSVAIRAVQRGRDEVESTLRARDAAQKVLEGERTRLELQPMDRRTNEELLRAQDALAQARQDHLAALLNFNLALTELARAQGTLLDEHGIEILWPDDLPPDRLQPLRTTGPDDAPHAREEGLPQEP